MKPIFLITTILALLGLGQTPTLCERNATFGDIDVCLPKIEGMVEAYPHPKVKQVADYFEVAQNSVLGFYLNDETYSKVDSLEHITYDDYIKVYATNSIKGIKIGKDEIGELVKMLKGNFIQDNWEEVTEEAKEKIETLSIEQPTMIDSYSPQKNVHTLQLLSKFKIDDLEHVMVMTMNMLVIKERMIWMAYYLDYEGKDSIKKSRIKNEAIVKKMMDANP